MVLSLLFIILLRFLAGIMVWVMIVMVILVLGYGASPPSSYSPLSKVWEGPVPCALVTAHQKCHLKPSDVCHCLTGMLVKMFLLLQESLLGLSLKLRHLPIHIPQ